MAYVRVIDEERGYVTELCDPDDKWDRDNTAMDHDIRGIQEVEENKYFDLAVPFDIDPTRCYFLVYAIYSTGDSFGHDEGQIEFVSLHQDPEVAKENRRRLEEHSRVYNMLNRHRLLRTEEQKAEAKELKKKHKKFDSHSVTLVTDEGEEYSVHVPWNGYFENLTNVDVETVNVKV